LNWFKKLFGKFSDDEHEEIYEQKVEEFKEPRREQKDMDARIVYQYPKGRFKFPLIPDENELNQAPRKSREERVISSQRHVSVGMEGTGHKKVQPKTRVSQETINRVSPLKKSEPHRDVSRRPFRPTEIPSPVYGFGKRGIQQEKDRPVEYELNSFLETDYIERTLETPTQEERKDKIEVDVDEIVQVEEKPIARMEETVINEFPIDRVEETTISTEPIELNLMDLEFDSAITETVSATRPFALEHVQTIQQEEVEDDVPMEELGEMEVAVAVESVIDEVEQEIIEENVQEKELVISEEEQVEEEPVVSEMDLEEVENEDLEGEIEEEPINNAVEAPIEPAPKRKHLPFNVLMLKEDRRKLEEKKRDIKSVSSFAPPVQSMVQMETDNNEQFADIVEEAEAIEEESPYYVFPEYDLLSPPVIYDTSGEWLEERERLLNDTLESFNVRASVVNVTQGPSVTRFEVQPEPGVKVNKITNLADDIKLSLAAKDIRIEAPIPGKHTIGIEVPNEVSRPVLISEIIQSSEFLQSTSPLTAVLGLDISGKPIVTDLRKMPHGLIAGATGSGKSVCINTILVSLLYKARPDELKLLLIDPKMVELAPYNQIPHLVSPVITDVKAATAALKWAVEEMERRYELFAHTGVREINRFNEQCEQHNQHADKLPFIVIIIDELADLMMMAPADVEEAICRIAQKARACGIHLIIATQRPSVDVITGLIKANVPTRIAFSVSSQIDSRTIIDISGAERLLGRGDMLFLENGSSKPVRLQGTFVSDEEIDQVVAHVRREQSPNYLFHQEELLKRASVSEEEDELFFEACEFVVDQGSASTSSLQRRFKIGYNRAARLIDMMEKNGYISENRGSKPRDVLINGDDLQSIQEI
jgi:DNA segregation ATPase FtsK/SpoIIIE, S-DNA-T family